MAGAALAREGTRRDDAVRLKALVQQFSRNFGLLVTKRTPCGFPISPSHAHSLMILRERERDKFVTSQTELGARLTIDKSSITRLCRKLESSGHATQTRSPSDGRGRIVRLTAEGRRLAERLEIASQERFARVLSAVSPGKRSMLLSSLEELVSAVSALDEEDEA
jgi:DNA-binding MarR family transcriptional regulator